MPGKGKRHGRWNDGKLLSSHGYVKLRVGRNHPLADPNGYAYEHLLVWVASGRPQPSNGEVLHHVNGDKADNRIENLEIQTRAEHNRHHNTEKGRDDLGRFKKKKAAGRLLDGRTWDQYPGPVRLDPDDFPQPEVTDNDGIVL